MTKRKNASSQKSKQSTTAAVPRRSRTVERRQERERQKRRRQQITIIGIVVAAAVIGLVLIFLANQPAEAPISEEARTLYEGIEQGKTTEGYPRLGDPQAPVQVVEYSSFDCPSCARFHKEELPGLMDRVRSGEINFTYLPLYGTGGIQNGQGAARTALCAGEQGAFWTMHSALFDWQLTFGTAAFSQNRLNSGIGNLGLDRGAYDQCMASSLPDDVLNAGLANVTALGSDFVGTPSIFVNGVSVTQTLEAINTQIDAVLATLPDRPSAESTEQPSAEATMEATEEPEAEMTEAPTEETPEATEAASG